MKMDPTMNPLVNLEFLNGCDQWGMVVAELGSTVLRSIWTGAICPIENYLIEMYDEKGNSLGMQIVSTSTLYKYTFFRNSTHCLAEKKRRSLKGPIKI